MTKQKNPVIAFIDNTNHPTSPTKKPFDKPPKWSFTILKFLLVILVPLLSNSPDIQLNFYVINIIF